MEKEINDFHISFAAHRVGGIRAGIFPRILRDLVIRKFGNAKYADRFTVNLAEAVTLVMELYDLRKEIDLEKLPAGMREDIMRHLEIINQLWARMDKALIILARQKYEYGWKKVTSVDGMKILEDACSAVSLHEFLENLDLFPDTKFMEKIGDWRKSMEFILTAILKSLKREKEAQELVEVSEEITAQLESRWYNQEGDPVGKISTIL